MNQGRQNPYRPPDLPKSPMDNTPVDVPAFQPLPGAKGSRWVGTLVFVIVFAAVGDIVFRPLLDMVLLASEARSWGIILGCAIGAPIGYRACRTLEGN